MDKSNTGLFAGHAVSRTDADHPTEFDPVSELLIAPVSIPRTLQPVNLRVLSPFQRALLVIDGTVTTFLEAYTLEPIDIQRLSHEVSPLAEANTWLNAERGTRVARRQVLINGRHSHTLHVYAVSLVVLDRLPETARQRLEIDGEGIGRVLNASALETRREILWYGREHARDLPRAVHEQCHGEFLTRAYRIIHDQQPIALLTERFPISSEPLPSPY